MTMQEGAQSRKVRALFDAAFADLGERGTVDLGYRTRGSLRVWRAGGVRPMRERVGIGYAYCARCDAYHIDRTDARDRTLTVDRARPAMPSRIGRRLPITDADTGRKVVGAIVTGAPRTLALGGADASNVRVRALQRDARVRAYVREGVC